MAKAILPHAVLFDLMIRWIEAGLYDRNSEDRHIDFPSNNDKKEEEQKETCWEVRRCFRSYRISSAWCRMKKNKLHAPAWDY